MFVLILVVVLAVSSASGVDVTAMAPHITGHLPGPPFLANVTLAAKTAYYKILNNKTLTRTQQTDALLKWGSDNKVQAAVQAFVAKQAKDLQGYRQNITIFLDQLLQYEKEIDAIYFNNNITVAQREHMLHSMKCPPALKKVLAYASTVVRKHGAPPPFKNSSVTSAPPKPTVAVEPVTSTKRPTTHLSTKATTTVHHG